MEVLWKTSLGRAMTWDDLAEDISPARDSIFPDMG